MRPEPLLASVQRARGGHGGKSAAGSTITEPDWVSAIESLPPGWDERQDVLVKASDAGVREEMNFCSRRRAEPETLAELLERRLPHQLWPPKTAPADRPEYPSGWPEGAPPRPISADMLWKRGVEVINEILDFSEAAAAAASADCIGEPHAKIEPLLLKESELHEWVKTVPGGWDTTDLADCVPVGWRTGSGSLRSRAAGDVDAEALRQWGRELGSKDMGMLSSIDGVVAGSGLSQDTVLMYHHTGFRKTPGPMMGEVQKEERAGRCTLGSPFPPIIPFRSVAYNCLVLKKYRMQDGEMVEKDKARVTTDDSIVVDGSDSRNAMIDKSLWPDHNLCAIQHLAEAVAIMRTARTPEAIAKVLTTFLTEFDDAGLSPVVAEKIVLWALDLSDAYRMLAVHWSELWQQGFIWIDGFRVNLRCLFGTSSMVGFFQRVSMHVKRRGDMDARRYDRVLPPAASTRVWMQRLAERMAGFNMMYLDDMLGATFLAAGQRPVAAHRTSATLAGVESRPQAHQRLNAQRFRKGGWKIAPDKIELGFRIVGLGLGIDSGDDPECPHEGDLFCPETKRRGMILDAEKLLPEKDASKERALRRATPRGPVDKLVGRLGNISQIEPAGRAQLGPLFAAVAAKHKVHGKLKLPTRLWLHGEASGQLGFQESLAWWLAALNRGVAAPLTPKRTFPPLGAPGTLAVLTDAAREDGTGVGGFTCIQREAVSKPSFLYVSVPWPRWALDDLQSNRLSMPAGEGYGSVAFIDAVLRTLEGVTHLYVFTDCLAFKCAVNSEASGSPQMDALVRWLFAQHPDVQFLAFHQPGKRNRAADGLSRDGHGGETAKTILREVLAADLLPEELELSDVSWEVFKEIASLPQRATKGLDTIEPPGFAQQARAAPIGSEGVGPSGVNLRAYHARPRRVSALKGTLAAKTSKL